MDALTELKVKYKLGGLSQTEWLLITVILLVAGIVLGMVFSPKGSRAIASNNSNNGNSNGNNNTGSLSNEEGNK